MSEDAATEVQLAATNRRIDHLIATLEANDIPFTPAPRVNQPPTGDPHLTAFFTKDDRFLRIIDSNHTADDLAIVAWDIEIRAKVGLREIEGMVMFSNPLPLSNCWAWTAPKGKTVFGTIEEGDRVQLHSGSNKFVCTVRNVHRESCSIDLVGRVEVPNEAALVQVKGMTFSKDDRLTDLAGNKIDYEPLLGSDIRFRSFPAQEMHPGPSEVLKVSERAIGPAVSRPMAIWVSHMHLTERQIEIVANVPKGA